MRTESYVTRDGSTASTTAGVSIELEHEGAWIPVERPNTGTLMNRSELIHRLADKPEHLPYRDVELGVANILGQITNALASGERVELRGFGSFRLVFQPAYIGCNPRTGEPIMVPDKHMVRFKPGKELRRRVNGGNAREECTDASLAKLVSFRPKTLSD